MAKNSGYLKRLEKQRQEERSTYIMWSVQLALDIMTGVLNDKEVLGSSALGAGRLLKVQDAFNERFPDYLRAVTKDKEADYLRAKIDQQQRQIFGEKALSWEQRYEGWEE